MEAALRWLAQATPGSAELLRLRHGFRRNAHVELEQMVSDGLSAAWPQEIRS
jgi:hypothetical protein